MNDPNLHLFVDDFEIQHCINATRELNRPRKHSEPVVIADQPWEGSRAQAWGSVIREPDGLLRMFYFAMNVHRRPDELERGGYALAESRDGIHWTKPSLGVVRFRGSGENNLWYTFAPDGNNLVDEELARRGIGLPATDRDGNELGVLNNMDGLTVVRDADEPDPQKRYKLIANMQDHRMWAPAYPESYPDVTDEQVAQARSAFGQYLDTSPDGVHWTRKPVRLLECKHGDYMMVMRDERNKRWWLNERPLALFGRNAAMRTSNDLIDWTDPAEMIFSNDASMGFGKTYEWHGGITPFNYGNLNMGFLEKWNNAGWGDNLELVCNRDGQPWQRVAPGKPFLDVGPEGAFDRTLVYPSHNEPIKIGDMLYIFYTGGGADVLQNMDMGMAMGVATIGLDRFAGLAHSRREPAEVLRKPVTISESGLEVNAEMVFRNDMQLAIRGTDDSTIEGFGFENSVIDLKHASPRKPVKWREEGEYHDLTSLIGRKVFLHFKYSGAILYGYRFSALED